jgi:hypothetical protein
MTGKIANRPDFTLEKVKFGTDKATFEKAAELYKNGKVTQVKEGIRSYFAVVLGTKSYNVSVEARNFRFADCTCYLGQKDVLCKHAVALAICAALGGEPLPDKDMMHVSIPSCSGILRRPSPEEVADFKKSVTDAMRYIMPYRGPSRTWFSYQNSLQEGCNRLSAIVAALPVDALTAGLLANILQRLHRKLTTGGVDDSDGIVGDFIGDTVSVLQEYTKLDPSCQEALTKAENLRF